MELRRWCCPKVAHEHMVKWRTDESSPSTSKLVARYCKATTPGSVGTKTDDPLRAFACATDDTPIYITKELMRERLYVSVVPSGTADNFKRSLSEARKLGAPRFRRY